MCVRERSNMCKGFKLKNVGFYLGNCGYMRKNIFMLERGRELCLYLIIFWFICEVFR